MNVFRVGGAYFAAVFSAGFVLGVIRVLWLVPYVGARVAELMEAPVMLLVCVAAALWLVRRFEDRMTGWKMWLGAGLVGLGIMILVELTAVLMLRGISLRDYFADRDPVTGTVYLALLGVFAALPSLLVRSRTRRASAPGHGKRCGREARDEPA